MNLIERHFRNTETLLRAIQPNLISNWLLNQGYFPEQYVLPPTFRVNNFTLGGAPKNADLANLARREIVSISYPKTLLSSREFGIQHPSNYHDIVYYLMEDWNGILDILFHTDLKIHSYSLPIPVNARNQGSLSPLRSGRMIYEWIAMAERDLVAEAHQFNYIVRSDITNFYNSVYTHSIAWAIHGHDDAFNDKVYALLGNKIDRLVQYANEGRTNGIPVGSALSDLIAEIVLSAIDKKVSVQAKQLGIDFIATRFKDDYRILCNKKQDGETVLKILAEELRVYNLSINENKTVILDLPTGLYRQHDREYHPFSLRNVNPIDFKRFELTLLKVLDIHREFNGTSILEKFFSELFDNDYNLKIVFSPDIHSRRKQILKSLSLLMLIKRESEKVLCHVLATIEAIYLRYKNEFDLKSALREIIVSEFKKASDRKSVFELTWLVFFSRYIGLGITNISELVGEENKKNLFLKSMTSSQQKIFNDSGVDLFQKPSDCKGVSIARRLAVFNRND